MKAYKKIIAAFFLILTVALSLTSCSRPDGAHFDKISSLADSVLSSMMSEEGIASAYPLFDERYCSEDETTHALIEMRKYTGDFSSFEIKEMTGYYYRDTKDISYVSATFLVSTDVGEIYAVVTKMNDSDKIAGLQVYHKEDMKPSHTGTLSTMKGSNIPQWAVLVLGIAVMVFAFWMAVDCIMSKIEKKVWWVIAVLLGFLSVTVTFTPDESFRIFFGIGFILSSSVLKIYSTSAVELLLILPIGAFIYFINRKKLKARAYMKKKRPTDKTAASDTGDISNTLSGIDNVNNTVDSTDSADTDTDNE